MPARDAAPALFEVRLTPRASRATVELDGELVRARVTAPAIEGRANAALLALLARRLRVAKRDVAIVRGHRARVKQVAVVGLTRAEALARLGASS